MLVDCCTSLKLGFLIPWQDQHVAHNVSHDESASHVQEDESSISLVQSSCKAKSSMMSQSDLFLIS